ncbi:hypothetical protein L9F63_003300, partial [Diploptera punctata]
NLNSKHMDQVTQLLLFNELKNNLIHDHGFVIFIVSTRTSYKKTENTATTVHLRADLHDAKRENLNPRNSS